MSPDALTRLRRRLLIGMAVILAAGIGLPTLGLIGAQRGRASERFDTRVGAAVRDVDLVVAEDDDGTIDLSAYEATPRPAPPLRTAVLDARGRFVSGDGEIPGSVRRTARVLARTGDERTSPADGGDVRVAAVGLEGEQRTLGVAVAYARTAELSAEQRSDALLLVALALAGWALALGAAYAIVVRALAPAGALARREQAFLADAAHELRTPWAIVRGRAERGLRDGPQEDDLRFVRDTAGAASLVITDMLEIARLDAGRAVAERVNVALDVLVGTCLDEREDAAELAGVRVERTIGRVVVEGDERLLTRAVGNLLDNALRHGSAGGVLAVAVSVEGAQAAVRVADHGPGIPPGQRERIFDRFHRGPAAGAGGAGLGLPIAALVAEAHGGTLALLDAGGDAGAVFVLRVPVPT